MEKVNGKTSDGYHTFDELYYHRTVLFSILCRQNQGSWRSNKHEDGSMFEGMFIAGIETPEGSYTYHCEDKYRYLFRGVKELENAPKYDGHLPSDIDRLISLLDEKRNEMEKKEEIEIDVTIWIDGKDTLVTMEQARVLYEKLKKIFEEKTVHEFFPQGLHYKQEDGGIREFDPSSIVAPRFGEPTVTCKAGVNDGMVGYGK